MYFQLFHKCFNGNKLILTDWIYIFYKFIVIKNLMIKSIKTIFTSKIDWNIKYAILHNFMFDWKKNQNKISSSAI